MLLIILQSPGPPPRQRIIQPKMSRVSGLRDPDRNQTPSPWGEVICLSELLQLLKERAHWNVGRGAQENPFSGPTLRMGRFQQTPSSALPPEHKTLASETIKQNP